MSCRRLRLDRLASCSACLGRSAPGRPECALGISCSGTLGAGQASSGGMEPLGETLALPPRGQPRRCACRPPVANRGSCGMRPRTSRRVRAAPALVPRLWSPLPAKRQADHRCDQVRAHARTLPRDRVAHRPRRSHLPTRRCARTQRHLRGASARSAGPAKIRTARAAAPALRRRSSGGVPPRARTR
jgi:hypothetical protein